MNGGSVPQYMSTFFLGIDYMFTLAVGNHNVLWWWFYKLVVFASSSMI